VDIRISEYQAGGHQGTGIVGIVHGPNLKNKIDEGTALIVSLRNSGENPN
jgi:hypothetical protein